MIFSNSTSRAEAQASAQTSSAAPGNGGPVEVIVSPLSEHEQVTQLLTAAAAATGPAVALDDFMHLAWEAFVAAHPGMRERMADAQLLAQIRDLRQQGRVGQA